MVRLKLKNILYMFEDYQIISLFYNNECVGLMNGKELLHDINYREYFVEKLISCNSKDSLYTIRIYLGE